MNSKSFRNVLCDSLLMVLLGGLFFFAYDAVYIYDADAVSNKNLIETVNKDYCKTDNNETYDVYNWNDQSAVNVQSRIIPIHHYFTSLRKYQKTQKIKIAEKSNLLSSKTIRLDRQLYLEGLCNSSFFSPKDYLSRLSILII